MPTRDVAVREKKNSIPKGTEFFTIKKSSVDDDCANFCDFFAVARNAVAGTCGTDHNVAGAHDALSTDVNAKNASGSRSALIVRALGGKENISDIDCCATRLRITVQQGEKVSDAMLKESGAAGVIRKGNGVQVIYGPVVAVIKSELED